MSPLNRYEERVLESGAYDRFRLGLTLKLAGLKEKQNSSPAEANFTVSLVFKSRLQGCALFLKKTMMSALPLEAFAMPHSAEASMIWYKSGML